MKNRSVPTLEDVAREAGVSTATVSRCLNTPDRVVKATRDRVLGVVDRLGYAPNFGAQSLAAKRTSTIGAIIPTMENAIFGRGIQAFQEELRDLGITLLVASSSYQQDVEAEQIRTLTARGADGLLLIGHDRSTEAKQFLKNRGLPTLISWAYDPTEPALSIGFDNKQAMQELAKTIIDLGHKDIAMISANTATNDRARNRVAGVYAAMAEAGLSPQGLKLIETPYGIASGAEAFNQLMSGSNRPSVVICGNDVLAVGALRQAKDMGLKVPDDISITGFDDIELSTLVEPQLTTVHVPHREMGQRAARMLVEMVGGEVPDHSVCLNTELRMRGSLAAPND